MKQIAALVLCALVVILGMTGLAQAQGIQVHGVIQAVDCQTNALVLSSPDGVHVLPLAHDASVSVNSAPASFCNLSHYIGSTATVTITAVGNQLAAGRVDVVQGTAPGAPAPTAPAPSYHPNDNTPAPPPYYPNDNSPVPYPNGNGAPPYPYAYPPYPYYGPYYGYPYYGYPYYPYPYYGYYGYPYYGYYPYYGAVFGFGFGLGVGVGCCTVVHSHGFVHNDGFNHSNGFNHNNGFNHSNGFNHPVMGPGINHSNGFNHPVMGPGTNHGFHQGGNFAPGFHMGGGTRR
jgi:hypothetical protein